jgi:PAS domain S-box-containing protein
MDCNTGKVIFNENKVKMLGYKLKDFKDVDYTAFTNLLHPDDYDFVMKAMRDHLEGKKKIYEVEYRIKTKKGDYKWFYDRGSVVKRDSKNKPLIAKGIVYDITDRKNMELELEKTKDNLINEVEKQTIELAKSNKILKEEIYQKEKAEQETKQTKNYLNNIIDSASELIVSFDMNNRVKTWNKTAEIITGYKKIEVINRSISKLEVFENAKNLIEILKDLCASKNTSYNDITLVTKNNNKRILRIFGSEIINREKQCIGTIIMGRDITKELEIHGKLLEGNSYLITDQKNISAIDLLNSLCSLGKKGLFITRSSPAQIKIYIQRRDIETILLSEAKISDYNIISNLTDLIKVIENFTKKNKNSIILIDGIHYLLTRFSFDEFIGVLYKINDTIAENKSILILRVDPSTVDSNQMAIFENELQTTPSQKIENLIIQDDVYQTLEYIFEQNELNAAVSYKKVMKKFKIAYMTAAKRIDDLEEKGLIFTKRLGKIRAVYISDKGKKLLHNRKTA